jgi:hypothetical protein
LPPAWFTFIPVKVATPDDAVADAAVNVAFTDPDATVAVIVAVLDVTVLPAESTTRTTGTVPRVAPGNTPPTGCVVIANAVAEPAPNVTVRSAFGQPDAENRIV